MIIYNHYYYYIGYVKRKDVVIYTLLITNFVDELSNCMKNLETRKFRSNLMHEIEINLKHDVKNVFHLGIIFTRIFDNSGYRWMIYYSRGQRVIGNEKGEAESSIHR